MDRIVVKICTCFIFAFFVSPSVCRAYSLLQGSESAGLKLRANNFYLASDYIDEEFEYKKVESKEDEKKSDAGGFFSYQRRRKAPFLAVLLDYFIPFAGCIYGDSVECALADCGGVLFTITYLRCYLDRTNSLCFEDPDDNLYFIVAGAGFRVAAYVFAYLGVERYNRRLREELGLEAAVVPLHDGAAGMIVLRF